MYNRFTDDSKQVLRYARTAAQRMAHNYVGTEHILLGLVLNEDGAAGQMLRDLGLTTANVTRALENIVGLGMTPDADLILTRKMKQAMEFAVTESKRLNRNYVGTEHILLGILQQRDSMAVQVLESMDVDPAALIERINEFNEDMPYAEGAGEGAYSPNEYAGAAAEEDSGEPNLLTAYGRNLNDDAAGGKIDPVIGRDKEVERVIQILCRRTKNNPILLGAPGVGKTAIAEGLAQKIVDRDVPYPLADKQIFSLNLSSLVAGTKYRGEFEERIKRILEKAEKDPSVILFIDELHQLVGAGSAEGTMDAADIMKPALARGELQCIGATTTDEYKKHIEKDSALTRRFQPVRVDEPTQEDALQILRGLRSRYEDFHHVTITDRALEEAVTLSARYIADRYLPDKAIDVIDEASAKVRLREAVPTAEVKALKDELSRMNREKEALLAAENFEKCADLRDRIKEAEDKLESVCRGETENKERPVVSADDIADVVSVWSGVPVQQITETESQRLMHLEEELHKRVISQDEAVTAVARAVRRARAGLKDEKRPIGSFLFLGPSGVGKTELARTLAGRLFGSEDAMIRIDMSEFMESHAVARLIGAPPGYVGHDDGGELTDKVREKPYSVILFDEVEKANRNFFNILLQILDDGRLTDTKGRTVDFRNTVIIMTSNLGATHLRPETPTMGFAVGGDTEKTKMTAFEQAEKEIMGDVRRFFRPEFINRLDEMIIFRPLEKKDLQRIVGIMLDDLMERLSEKGVQFKRTEAATDVLVGEGTDFAYGARPLRRSIQKLVEDPIAELLLEGRLTEGKTVHVDSKDKKKLDFETI